MRISVTTFFVSLVIAASIPAPALAQASGGFSYDYPA